MIRINKLKLALIAFAVVLVAAIGYWQYGIYLMQNHDWKHCDGFYLGDVIGNSNNMSIDRSGNITLDNRKVGKVKFVGYNGIHIMHIESPTGEKGRYRTLGKIDSND